MQTLNQHITLFRDFANSHLQINSFGVGELWELTEKNGGRIYPIMWMVIDPHSINGNELVENYTFVFADLVRPDESNEDDVLSDQKQSALDFLSFLRFSTTVSDEIVLMKSSNLTPFTEKFEDNLAGWIVTVQLKQSMVYNYCDAPVSGLSPAEPVCRGVAIYNNNVYEQTIASGGRFDYTNACDDATININNIAFDTVAASGTLNIPVVNVSNQAVGTITAGVKVEVQNGIVQVNNVTMLNNEPESTVGIDVVNTLDNPIGYDDGGVWKIANSDVLVINTDLTVLATESVVAEESAEIIIPDINLTQPNGSVKTELAGIDLSCTQIGSLACQDLSDQLTPTQINNIQRQQPTRTGQTTSYRTGDDGDLELGLGTAFSTLDCNNIFGNTNRFTDDTGAQTYTNNFVLDHLTGLMWYRSLPATASWNTCIDNALSSTQGGFTDWFLPNYNQLVSLFNWSLSSVLNYSPINVNSVIWTSTTNPSITTAAYRTQTDGLFISNAKGNLASRMICRRFIPSDFGL